MHHKVGTKPYACNYQTYSKSKGTLTTISYEEQGAISMVDNIGKCPAMGGNADGKGIAWMAKGVDEGKDAGLSGAGIVVASAPVVAAIVATAFF